MATQLVSESIPLFDRKRGWQYFLVVCLLVAISVVASTQVVRADNSKGIPIFVEVDPGVSAATVASTAVFKYLLTMTTMQAEVLVGLQYKVTPIPGSNGTRFVVTYWYSFSGIRETFEVTVGGQVPDLPGFPGGYMTSVKPLADSPELPLPVLSMMSMCLAGVFMRLRRVFRLISSKCGVASGASVDLLFVRAALGAGAHQSGNVHCEPH